MTFLVDKEKAFSVPVEDFTINPTTAGFTLAYSVDGTSWSEWEEAVSANELCIVKNSIKNLIYKLVDNVDDDVLIMY